MPSSCCFNYFNYFNHFNYFNYFNHFNHFNHFNNFNYFNHLLQPVLLHLEILECSHQQLAGAEKPGFDGADGDAKFFGNLRV